MSNTPKSVSSDQLNTLKLVKTIMPRFFKPLLCVWISDETLVFGVLLLKCRFQTETIEHSPSWFVCYIVMCTRIPYSCGAPRLVLGGLSLCSGAIRFFSTFYESLSKPHEKKNTVKICID